MPHLNNVSGGVVHNSILKDNVLYDNIGLEKEHKTNEIKRVFREDSRKEV
jgi:hypothetical protein